MHECSLVLTSTIVHVPLVVLHCALAVSSGVISLCWLVLLRHIWVELPATKTTIMASINVNSNDIYSIFSRAPHGAQSV